MVWRNKPVLIWVEETPHPQNHDQLPFSMEDLISFWQLIASPVQGPQFNFPKNGPIANIKTTSALLSQTSAASTVSTTPSFGMTMASWLLVLQSLLEKTKQNIEKKIMLEMHASNCYYTFVRKSTPTNDGALSNWVGVRWCCDTHSPLGGGSWLGLRAIKMLGVKTMHNLFILIFIVVFVFLYLVEIHSNSKLI